MSQKAKRIRLLTARMFDASSLSEAEQKELAAFSARSPENVFNESVETLSADFGVAPLSTRRFVANLSCVPTLARAMLACVDVASLPEETVKRLARDLLDDIAHRAARGEA